MFAILSAITFGVAYILDIAKADVPIALTPGALTILGLLLLALHFCGVGSWTISRRQ